MYTYRELKFILSTLSERELDMTATVYIDGLDEYFPVRRVSKTGAANGPSAPFTLRDALEPGHPIIEID